MNKSKSLLIITAAYIFTFIFGVFLTLYLPEDNSLSKLFLINIFLTLFLFMFSFRFGNAAMYGPFWSAIPAYIIGYWWYSTMAIPNYVGWAVTSIIVLACRGAHNWSKAWEGMQQENWRHLELQDKTGKWYLLVNFLGIHMLPSLLVWVACIPIAYIFTSNEPFTIINWAGVLVAALGILLELVSDNQLRNFKESANSKAVLTSGLWRKIRHPNYLGEILFWWGIYMMSIGVFTPWFISSGAIGITLLFVFISVPMMDKHLLQTRPSYARYMLNAGGLIPKIRK
jgi:steroid 5-alpha reductase family enzyme